MTVSRLSENRVLIYLGEGDMRDFSLDFSRMGTDDGYSMGVLSRLSRTACRDKGISTGGKRLRVEALGMSEGCYLLVTVGEKKKTYRRKSGTVCYRFTGAGLFLDCVAQLCRAGITCAKSAAYEWQGSYYLVFGYPALPRQARILLSEFDAQKSPAATAARLSEYARVLCPRCAVSVIGGKME